MKGAVPLGILQLLQPLEPVRQSGHEPGAGADSPVTANKGVLPGGGKERRNIQLGLRMTF